MEGRITDKKTIGEKFGDKKLMDKKPIANSKYKNVAKVIDTGKTINDVQVLSDQFITKKKNELFKRIKATTLIKILEENNNTESIYKLADDEKNDEGIRELSENLNKGRRDNPEERSVYSKQTGLTNLSQASVKTTITAVTYATEMLGNLSLLSFLILDLRDTTEYDSYHIKESKSYPGPNISRDKFLPEMISLKNKDNKLIIIYGKDERSTIPYATLFYNKGYDNIYMLTGGIEDFVREFPEKCDGSDVQRLINQKLQEEILKKDILLKKTTMSKSNSISKNVNKQTFDMKESNLSSKASVISESENKSVKELKQNLKK